MNMNWELLGPLLVTTLVAVVGWVAAHRFAAARDRANKRRDVILERLVDAYLSLEGSANRPKERADHRVVERAVAEIQLWGSARQAELARSFGETVAETGDARLTDLLEELRKQLRCELGLSDAGKIKLLRFKDT